MISVESMEIASLQSSLASALSRRHTAVLDDVDDMSDSDGDSDWSDDDEGSSGIADKCTNIAGTFNLLYNFL